MKLVLVLLPVLIFTEMSACAFWLTTYTTITSLTGEAGGISGCVHTIYLLDNGNVNS